MTHISTLSTKKALKEAVAKDAENVFLEDPSMWSPISGSVAHIMSKTDSITVTNHPKRSWFAAIKNGRKGIVVS